MLLAALLAPASASAQKPFFDIRRAAEPSLQATRPLTGPVPAADRVTRALDFARAHAGALGLTPARVGELGAPARSTVSGIERLTWQRSFGGIPAFGDELRVAVGADGAVLSASGSGAEAAPPSLTPSLSAAQAMAVVSDDAGALRSPRVVAGPTGARRTTTFAGGGRAQLIVFGSRLAWRVAYPALPRAFYDSIIDATTGAILRRANLVKSAAPADVWNDHPDGSAPLHVDLEAFGPLRAGATLQNDWTRVFADENGSDTLDAGEEVSPPGAAAYAFTPFGACGATTPCTWDPTPAHPDWRTNRRQVAVQAFYLANRYREHLAAPPFSFDGFDSRRAGVLPLDIETDWGADFAGDPDAHPDDFDNSAMLIPPPGYRDQQGNLVPWAMELSLFGALFSDGDEGFRAMDAGDDASIVFHEYTHGFNNQTVTYDDGSEALDTAQAWAIDEASADFFAKSYLVDDGQETDTAATGQVDMGGYTDADPHSIRTQALDCPVGASAGCPHGGYTYASFGHVINRPEPHADGEIWGETMWDLRGALAPGRATALAAEALAIVPPQPSFLDARDAILAAATDGERPTIWQVFARRGMGCDAATNGSDDAAPHAGFQVPPCAAPTPTPTATATATATATVTATSTPTASPTPRPTATPLPTVSPTATPAAAPAATRQPPSLTLLRSGRRAVKFTVTCRAACSVTGTLRVSGPTARRLHLGSRRTVGTLRANLTAAARRTFTVRLSAAAARALKRAKSFKATLTVRAGYAGAAARSQHRTVTVKR